MKTTKTKANNPRVEYRLPAPFDYVRVDATPTRVFGAAKPDGVGIGIMNERAGEGTRSRLEYAEAEAKTVLKVIRAYRRKEARLAKAQEAEARTEESK